MSDSIRPEDDELLRREIDGESTAAERAVLRRRLDEVPELRSRHDMLRSLLGDLERVGLEDPPAGFAAAVVRAARQTAAPREAWWHGLRAAFARRPAFGYASALAAGAIVGALGVILAAPAGLDTGIDDSAAAGAMLPRARLAETPVLDRRPVAAGRVRGEVSTRQAEPGVVAEVRIDSGTDALMTLEFDPQAFTPLAFHTPSGFQGEAALKAGQLRLTGAGPGTYRLVLDPSGQARPPLNFRMRGPEHMVQHQLQTGK